LQWLKEVELVAETDPGGGCHVYEYIADEQYGETALLASRIESLIFAHHVRTADWF
jgi:hypothetical protein